MKDWELLNTELKMHQFIENGSITSTKGFKAAGIFSGLKKVKKDLALIYSDSLCTAAGTFTLNKVQAAPLLVTKNNIAGNNKIKAVLVNSGNANACTGDEGYKDALTMQQWCADALDVPASQVLIGSTGVIGQRLPMEKIKAGIEKIVPQITVDGGLDAAYAIMTTDTKPKSFALKVKLSGGEVTIGSICKGSGMIAPNMATMLAFISTDASIEQPVLQKLISACVGDSFNKITVDGETSTNDMVLILANGVSNILIKEDSEDYKIFKEALQAVSIEMAKSIVSDGEGATRLVGINVKNAKSSREADMVAKSIANSALVKTAIYGSDANWGRILSAAGQSGADIDPAKVSIYFDDMPVLEQNYTLKVNEEMATKILSKPEFMITVNLGAGPDETTWWTCDLTEAYVKINSDYRS